MSNNPLVDNDKVLVHVQSRKSDANNQTIVTRDGNGNLSTLGSNNITIIDDIKNHPLSGFFSVIQFNYPAIEDGVFRNLVAVDTTNQYISGDDDDFVIGGFYSEKHRQAVLDGFESLGQTTTFYLNDNAAATYIAGLNEITTQVQTSSGDVETLNDLVDQSGVEAGEFQYINTITYATNTPDDSSYDSLIDDSGLEVGEFQFIDMITYTVPGSGDTTSSYDVWSDSSMSTNNLSAASAYSVDGDDYNTTVVPLITAELASLT